MKFEKSINFRIRVTEEETDRGFIETQTVEANLLYAILEKLEEIRTGIIDVKNASDPIWGD